MDEETKCTAALCKVKDILPFVCTRCNKDFCYEHQHPPSHSCKTREELIQLHMNQSAQNNKKCLISGCATLLTPSDQLFQCDNCLQHFCIDHRQSAHNCSKPLTDEQRQMGVTSVVQEQPDSSAIPTPAPRKTACCVCF